MNVSFIKFITANWISEFGDLFRILAVGFWVLEASEYSLGVRIAAFIISTLPFFILSPFSGALTDILDRRKMIIVTNIVRSILSASLVVCVFNNQITLAFVILFLSSIVSVFFETSQFALLPKLVSKSYYPTASGIVLSGKQAITIIGPIIIGVAYYNLGAVFCFTLDAISFLISAILFMSIRSPNDFARKEKNPTYKEIIKQIAVSVNYIKRNNHLKMFYVLTQSILLTSTVNSITLILFITEVLHYPIEASGLMFTVSGIGQLVASSIASRYAPQLNMPLTLVVSALFICISQVAIGLSTDIYLFFVIVFLGALANAPYSIAYQVNLKNYAEENVIGTLYGFGDSLSNGLRLVIYFLIYEIAKVSSYSNILTYAGAIGIFIILVSAPFMLRSRTSSLEKEVWLK